MFSQKIPVIDPVHSVIMGLAEKTAKGCIGTMQRTQNGQKRSQMNLFYAMIKTSRIMKFFLPNLLVLKNVASVKCKRAETVKKYEYEPNRSPKGNMWSAIPVALL